MISRKISKLCLIHSLRIRDFIAEEIANNDEGQKYFCKFRSKDNLFYPIIDAGDWATAYVEGRICCGKHESMPIVKITGIQILPDYYVRDEWIQTHNMRKCTITKTNYPYWVFDVDEPDLGKGKPLHGRQRHYTVRTAEMFRNELSSILKAAGNGATIWLHTNDRYVPYGRFVAEALNIDVWSIQKDKKLDEQDKTVLLKHGGTELKEKLMVRDDLTYVNVKFGMLENLSPDVRIRGIKHKLTTYADLEDMLADKDPKVRQAAKNEMQNRDKMEAKGE
jgi:hypothetical protein